MGKHIEKEKVTSVLRKKAEKKLHQLNTTLPHELTASDSLNLIQELQVHQIELEMQNEELRKTQEKLEKSRATYADLYDFAPVGYFTFEKNGEILQANLTGAGLLGTERCALINTLFSQFISKDYQDEFFLHRRNVFDTSKRQTSDIKLKKKDGTEFYAQLESMAFDDAEGNRLCRTSVIDITLRKLAEMEQECMNATLADKRRELEKMIYVTTHDLSSTLVNIE